MSIKPDTWLTVTRPDEVAETWEGVTDDLYSFLWSLVSKYGPASEYGEPDVNAVTNFWKDIPHARQLELNRLAQKERAWVRSLDG